MATATSTDQCSICDEKEDTYECKRCLKTFCYQHLPYHQQEINQKFDQLQDNSDLFRKNDLKKELDQRSKLVIGEQSSSFIQEIYVIKPLCSDDRSKQNGLTIAGGNDEGDQLNQLHGPIGICIDENQTVYIVDSENHRIVEWKSNTQTGRIVAGGNGEGDEKNQLNGPTDVIIDKENNCLIIADRENRRVMRWSRQNNTTNGEILIGDIDCWGLAMDKNGSLYVSDCVKNKIKRWKRGENKGTVIAGGNGQGDQLNQFSGPSFIFIDENDSLYVSDLNNHRVMKWTKGAKEGIIVDGGNGEGRSLKQLSCPVGVTVDHLGQIYVADCWNHRVMCWCEGDEEGTIVVGGNNGGKNSDQFDGPRGLSFDVEGNLYVVDHCNDRIQKF